MHSCMRGTGRHQSLFWARSICRIRDQTSQGDQVGSGYRAPQGRTEDIEVQWMGYFMCRQSFNEAKMTEMVQWLEGILVQEKVF